MNQPDPLEMQGHIDAMRIVLARVIADLPVVKRAAMAKQAETDGKDFQRDRLQQMTHPQYVKAFDSMLRELA